MRVYLRGLAGLYDILWACNACMLLTGVGMIWGSRRLVAACLLTIFLDHVVWATEVVLMLTAGYSPGGPAAYLVWPETTAVELVTTVHHVFYVPLTLFVLYRSEGIGWRDFAHSVGMCFLLSAAGRYLAPLSVALPNGQDYYLNINMGHEMFKDVPIAWLHTLNQASGLLYLVALVVMGNALLHLPAFCVLLWFSRRYLEKPRTERKRTE